MNLFKKKPSKNGGPVKEGKICYSEQEDLPEESPQDDLSEEQLDAAFPSTSEGQQDDDGLGASFFFALQPQQPQA